MQILVLSIGMAFVWIFLVVPPSELTDMTRLLPEFVVGYVFGVAILTLFRKNTAGGEPLKILRIPQQIIVTVIYAVTLAIDVLRSGASVAWIVIQPDLPVKTSTFEISTEDTSENSLVSALSAYSITITPGEMVIDFVRDENDEFDEQTMIVHVLNMDKSNAETLSRDQVRRVRWIKRLLAIN